MVWFVIYFDRRYLIAYPFLLVIAKRGLSWHICYAIKLHSSTSSSIKIKDKLFEHRTFAHVFDKCVQNGRTVTSIIRDILLRIKSANAEIKYAFIRGKIICYKSISSSTRVVII